MVCPSEREKNFCVIEQQRERVFEEGIVLQEAMKGTCGLTLVALLVTRDQMEAPPPRRRRRRLPLRRHRRRRRRRQWLTPVSYIEHKYSEENTTHTLPRRPP